MLNLAKGDQLVFISTKNTVEVEAVISEIGYVYDDGHAILAGEDPACNASNSNGR